MGWRHGIGLCWSWRFPNNDQQVELSQQSPQTLTTVNERSSEPAGWLTGSDSTKSRRSCSFSPQFNTIVHFHPPEEAGINSPLSEEPSHMESITHWSFQGSCTFKWNRTPQGGEGDKHPYLGVFCINKAGLDLSLYPVSGLSYEAESSQSAGGQKISRQLRSSSF